MADAKKPPARRKRRVSVPESAARVRGIVSDRFGRTVGGVRVVAVDRDLRHEQELGEATTDAGGRYEIVYRKAQYAAAEEGTADLIVRLVDAKGATLAESATIFNAGQDETVLLTLDGEAAGSEYARLIAGCKPVLDGEILARLQPADVEFISRETGWDPARIGALVRAAELGEQGKLSVELLYGLFRFGLPTDLTALASVPADEVRATAKRAIAEHVVSSNVEVEVAEMLVRLRELGVGAITRAEGVATGLAALLTVAVADENARKRVAELWYDTGGGDDFWTRLADEPDASRQVRLGAEVARAIGAVQPLMAAALQRLGPDAAPEMLAAWRPEDWLALVEQSQVSVPSDLAEGDPEAARTRYAQALARGVADVFPQDALRARLQESTIPGGKDIAALLDERNIDLAATTTDFTALRDELGQDRAETANQLAALARVYRISPRFEHVEPLLAANLDSAWKISRRSADEFVRQFGDLFGVREAVALHRRALEINARALGYLLRYRQDLERTRPAALPAPRRRAANLPASWSSLFGSLDFCECPDCRSALSPAAYLVDLLQFVEHRGVGGGDAVQPLDALRARRPDIELIELSCDNTNTVLPTIDLVNELCEARLTRTPAPVATRRSAEELAVQPEYVNDAAYTDLKDRVHPWPLPLDRPWQELRLHLARLGAPRQDLLRKLVRRADQATAIAAERLGIAPDEIGHVTGRADTPAHQYWGLEEADWPGGLSNVRTMLDASGLEFDELQDLLATWFVRKGSGPTLTGSGCDLAGWRVGDLSELALARLQRFQRLQRRSDWSVTELDALLHGLEATDIDPGVLEWLGDIRMLQERLSVPVSTIAWWWHRMPTAAPVVPERAGRPAGAPRSPYDEIFQNPVRVGRVDPALASNTAAGGSIPEHAEAVRAALGITGGELAALLAAAPAAQISIPELSVLWREVTLARALQVPIADLLMLRSLTATDILVEQSPADVRTLVELVDRLPDWGFTPAELSRLLADPLPPTPEDDQQLDRLLVDLQQQLASSRQTSRLPIEFDATTLSLLLERVVTAPDSVAELARFFAPGAVADTAAARAELTTLVPSLSREQQSRLLGGTGVTIDDPRERLGFLLSALGVVDAGVQQFTIAAPNSFDTAALANLVAPEQVDRLSSFFATDARPDTADNRLVLLELLPDLRPHETAPLLVLGGGAAAPALRLAAVAQCVAATRMLAARLAAMFNANPPLVAALLDLLRIGPDGPYVLEVLTGDALAVAPLDGPGRLERAATQQARRAVSLVGKALLIAGRLGLAATDLPLVCGNEPARPAAPPPPPRAPSGWLNLSSLPVRTGLPGEAAPPAAPLAAFELLADFFARRKRRQRPGRDWALILRQALVAPAGAVAAELLPAVANALAPAPTALDATMDDVRRLVDALALGDDAPWQDGFALRLLDEALEQLAVTGAHAQTALSWTAETVTPEAAQSAVQTLRGRYSDDQWPSVARPLRDLLREQQRDALVAALVPAGEKPDDLTADLLIDVECAACAMTSRVEAAMGSVQTFVQRCLLGLELNVHLDAEAAAEWRWMSRYDLWEAQRKIFLYPEDYLHPELRDDKTPFFVELVQELDQGEVTTDRVESLYTRYLEQLDQVARLELCGCYHEEGLDAGGRTVDRLHVVGRTSGTPHVYWYRRLENERTWTPWEKVPLDIDSEGVVLSVSEGRLYLCWPLRQEAADSQSPPLLGTITGGPAPQNASGIRPPEPLKHLEVQLAFSERGIAGWGPKCVGDGFLRFDRLLRTAPETQIAAAEFIGSGLPGAAGVIAEVTSDLSRMRIANLPVDLRYWPLPQPDDIRLVADHVPQEANPVANGDRALATQLVVRCYLRRRGKEDDIAVSVGEFRLGSCHDTFKAKTDTNRNQPALLTPTWLKVSPPGAISTGDHNADDQTFELDFLGVRAPYPAAVDRNNPSGQLYPIRADLMTLSGGTGLFRLALPQGGEFLFNGGFFVTDDAHSFYVHPLLGHLDADSFVRRWALSSAEIPPAVVADAWQRTTAGVILASAGSKEKSRPSQLVSHLDADAVTALARSAAGKEPSTAAAVDPMIAPSLLACPLVTLAPRTGRFQFEPFDHPYVCQFLMTVRRGGVEKLLQRTEQEATRDYFQPAYYPTTLVAQPYPQDRVDFSASGAYSIYNWELFVHAPLLIAKRLHQDQRFKDALRWYQYVFNPTTSDTGPAPARYWNAEPLYQVATGDPADELLHTLAGDGEGTASLHDLVDDWRRNPFQPWRVARLRRMAIPKFVVMSYLDLLIDWGDSGFRQYTRESIRDATVLYTWAAQILGKRPVELPAKEPPAQSYRTLQPLLDDFSNAIVAVEEIMPASDTSCTAPDDASALRALGTTFYFCIPPNERLLGYWDRIADRLFKIRHCQDIDGLSRPLPLFDPPIDPDLLVRAAAAGVDLATVGAQAPLAPYRFPVVVAKAMEFCAEVRSLGSALLSALERRDGEQLARLRSTHELAMLDAVRAVREQQLAEAAQLREAVRRSQDIAAARAKHYQTLITNGLSEAEQWQLDALEGAQSQHQPQQLLENMAVIAQLVPDFNFGVTGAFGTPTTLAGYGGSKVGSALSTHAQTFGIEASRLSTSAGRSAAGAGYDRRLEEWQHQLDLASREVMQLAAQFAAAEVRAAIAKKELDNHDLQRAQAGDLDEAMRSRFTNLELYSWTVSQLSVTYFQAYGLALEAAQRAERAYLYEHPEQSGAFVNAGGWDSLHAGLLAGERLQADLRRMEAAWLAGNRREYELTKHVSLALLNPLALVQLRSQGHASFSLPEALFDADHPGHYLRRIKAVSLTVPAVIGPYTSVNCSLALSSSEVRIRPELGEGETRIRSYPAAVERIATSRGNSDAGVFELSFRDERYLPFEGAGAANSNWYLRIDPACNDFDLQTISDIILAIQYTARDGGEDFRGAVRQTMLDAREGQMSQRLFSARTDFSDAWHEFLHPLTNAPGQTLRLVLDSSRFPYRARLGTISISKLYVALVLSETGRTIYPPGGVSVVVIDPDGNPIPPDPADPATTQLPLPLAAAAPGEDRFIAPIPPVTLAVAFTAPASIGIQLPTDQLAANPALATDVAGVLRLRTELVADLLLLAEYSVS